MLSEYPGILRWPKSQAILPFHCLSDDNLLGQGGNSTVHRISDNVVLKTPHRYLVDADGPQHLIQRMEESQIAVEDEKFWYQVLDRDPHPNRVQSLMITKEGIFLPRLRTSLKAVIAESAKSPIDKIAKYRWAMEIAAAVYSLEKLGLAHCDISPRNIFIDDGHIKLGDFDAMTRYGETPMLFPPDWIWYDRSTSAQHDLFNVGDTLWELFTGQEYDWGTPEAKNEIPDTAGVECGEIMGRCWRQGYVSAVDLKNDLEASVLRIQYGDLARIIQYFPIRNALLGFKQARIMDSNQLAENRHEIEGFLVRES